MKFNQLIIAIVFSVITSVAVVSYYQSKGSRAAAPQESAYDRVLRTKTLRCGYFEWPPYAFMKDPKTGLYSGIFADVVDAMAKKLGIKVEWTESEGYGSFIESLRARRIDAHCTGMWRNAERGRYVAFTSPIFYSAVFAYVPTDEHRFDRDYSVVNDPNIRISTMDGEMSDVIAKQFFPKATEISLPQLAQATDILVNLADHKADIAFTETSFAEDFMKANPNRIRRAQDKPFQVFATPLAVEIHETQLRDMLDSALDEMRNQGAIEAIISKYNSDPKVFLRVAKPYAQ